MSWAVGYEEEVSGARERKVEGRGWTLVMLLTAGIEEDRVFEGVECVEIVVGMLVDSRVDK